MDWLYSISFSHTHKHTHPLTNQYSMPLRVLQVNCVSCAVKPHTNLSFMIRITRGNLTYDSLIISLNFQQLAAMSNKRLKFVHIKIVYKCIQVCIQVIVMFQLYQSVLKKSTGRPEKFGSTSINWNGLGYQSILDCSSQEDLRGGIRGLNPPPRQTMDIHMIKLSFEVHTNCEGHILS